MSPVLRHECIRLPVTALATVGPLLVAAEGPVLRFYYSDDVKQFTLLGSKKVFNDQAIHGIAVRPSSSNHVILAIWGGPFVRFLQFTGDLHCSQNEAANLDTLQLSPVTRASDWILDLAFDPSDAAEASEGNVIVCAAVTAHNALIKLTVQSPGIGRHSRFSTSQFISIRLSELTASSRCILYSAHLLWAFPNHILVAAGTAFGEIIFWSWTDDRGTGPSSRTHRVFLGHEGSIFGVRISNEMEDSSGKIRRLLASCSDDRTIRIWDLTDIHTTEDSRRTDSQNSDTERTRHTGFSSDSFDAESNSPCVAIGWGHLSRVWEVRFLDSEGLVVSILSSGEDATSRTWHFRSLGELSAPSSDIAPSTLTQMSVAGFHSGKNIWSTTLFQPTSDQQQVICGAADSKITAFPLPISPIMGDSSVPEYTVWDILKMSKLDTGTQPSEKEFTTKLADFFRGYAFLGPTSFLLTTNSGKICLVTMTEDRCGSATARISSSELVEQLDELSSYSVCTSGSVLGNGGISFVAGAKGGIYMYRSGSAKLLKIHTVQGKVGNMFTTRTTTLPETEKIVLLITLMGQKLAKLLYIDTVGENEPLVTRAADLHFSDQITGGTVTSMEYITTDNEEDYICLGFRGGSVAGYTLAKRASAEDNDGIKPAFIERVHGKEAVTSMLWFPSRQYSSYGNLVSVGRDGCCAIHHIEFSASTLSLVHFLPLPVGPNIEGLYYLHGALIAYGFSSTKFIVYNITTEEEVMSVGTGGSHRSWSFRPHTSQEGGGTLIWTRASTMHIFTQKGPNHAVIRPGGHGREIKSVAISENYFNREDGRKLIATGAEDTDIKIFEYAAGGESGAEGAFLCRRTLRKHNTGIQQLKWSDNGAYLFSSGGCEEFYVWRVRNLPGALGIGIICESVCPPESEASDVRLTSFDVRRQAENAEADGCFVIAMVFSDSKIRVYTYTPTATAAEGKWNMLGKGTYFTSCLTQCVVLSPHTLLTTGTDGHAVFWTLPSTTTTADEKKHTATKELAWHHPSRIHQNTSKTLDTHLLPDGSTLVASGGDDGSLALLLTPLSPAKEAKGEGGLSYPHPPVVLLRAHASAITACTILSHDSRIYVLTSGNDQWIRLWQVDILANSSLSETEPEAVDANQDVLRVKRVKKIKTNVADVSSMAVLEESRDAAKVVVCGVGMEVLNVQWDG